MGDVDGAEGVSAGEGVGELDVVGGGGGEDFGEVVGELVFGDAVGPEGEDAAGLEVGGEFEQAFLGVEAGVGLGEDVGGCVVDVEEDGVVLTVWILGVEAGAGAGGEGEEVGVLEAAAGVGGEGLAEGDESAAVPVDDAFEVLDDDELVEALLVESGGGGVAEAESADDDVELVSGAGGEAELGELLDMRKYSPSLISKMSRAPNWGMRRRRSMRSPMGVGR